MKRILIILVLIFNTDAFSQTNRVILDGQFTDWNNISVLDADTNDSNSGMDLNNLTVFNDENYLFVSINLGIEANLQDNNQLTLYLDTDNNPNTGIAYSGIGAELKFVFGNRSGQVSLNGNTISVIHSDFGFFSAPTVTSNRFEFAIDRAAQINGIPLFSNNTIKIVLKDFSDGDQIPNSSGGDVYTFADNNLEPLPDFSISKYSSGSIRIAAYNVLHDGLFNSGKEEYFSRMLKAIVPEVIGFEEVSQHSAVDAKNRMEQFLPSSDGQSWFAAKSSYDLILASRYNIVQSQDITTTTGSKRSAAFLLNLRPKFDTDMLVILSHPKCCGGDENDGKRQAQVDAIMAFIRDAENGVGNFTIAENTPFVIMGDMNFVGSSRQPQTIISGDIFDNTNYGDDFNPDWDRTELEDAVVTTTNSPFTFTWYDTGSSFPPGRLDYIFYSGSVLKMKNSFALFTPFLNESTLSQFNLLADDAVNASDHIPVVSDFKFVGVTGVKTSDNIQPNEIELYQNYPNPFNPATTIKYSIPVINRDSDIHRNDSRIIKLKIFDVLGREIRTLVNEKQSPGNYQVQFDARGLPSGVYIYRLEVGTILDVKKMLLLK